jgi:nicotinate-nucleotide adenylyltransferase
MIGILGGTFDPIHYGHLRTALDVKDALGLTEVRFIPLAVAVHRKQPGTPADIRMEMVKAAIAGQPGFIADDREIRRGGGSYMLDTLRSLRREVGETIPLCLIIGMDAFRGFPAWRQPEEILQLAHLVVMERPGEAEPALYPQQVTDDEKLLRSRQGGHILFQPVPQLEISATAIRESLRQGRSPRFLLPDRVLEIIRKEALYA